MPRRYHPRGECDEDCRQCVDCRECDWRCIHAADNHDDYWEQHDDFYGIEDGRDWLEEDQELEDELFAKSTIDDSIIDVSWDDE